MYILTLYLKHDLRVCSVKIFEWKINQRTKEQVGARTGKMLFLEYGAHQR